MTVARALALVAVVAWAPAPAAAADALPRAEPESVGLSTEKLAGIDALVRRHIDDEQITGAVTVVARGGKVAYLRAAGNLREDTIFRIFSMSKPITAVAAAILVDDRKLRLDDPLAKFVPEFADVRVHGSDAEPPPITVRDLCRHTSGFTYGLFGNTPVDQAYRRLDLLNRETTLEQMAKKLAGAPLLHRPGTRWHYGVSTDVLGRVVEVASGTSLDRFLRTRIFTPLGMHDTAFHVPAAKADRLAPNYGGGRLVIDDPKTSAYLRRPQLFSGGGGLVSTARDYTRFCLMLRGGGTLGGRRILKERTVAEITRNQLPEEALPIAFAGVPMAGTGFGLGMSVRVADAPGRRTGEYGWGGAASTTFWVCPADDLIVINLIQRMPMWPVLAEEIRPVVKGALLPPKPR